MKHITLILLLLSALATGQYFEQDYAEEPETHSNTFFNESQAYQEPEPEYGVDAAGPGDDVPLDDWAFLLPLAGMAIGVYFIRRRKMVND